MKHLKCTVLAVVGYILSPLSFWHDLFVNFPIAYVFGFLVGLISQKLFLTGLIAGYWLSNIAGFVCMVNPNLAIRFTRSALIKDGLLSLVYTGVLVLLVKAGVLKFLPDYFN